MQDLNNVIVWGGKGRTHGHNFAEQFYFESYFLGQALWKKSLHRAWEWGFYINSKYPFYKQMLKYIPLGYTMIEDFLLSAAPGDFRPANG